MRLRNPAPINACAWLGGLILSLLSCGCVHGPEPAAQFHAGPPPACTSRQPVGQTQPAHVHAEEIVSACNDQIECGESVSTSFPETTSGQVQEDLSHFWEGVKADTEAAITAENAMILSLALAASVGVHQDWDTETREYVEEHPGRWGKLSRVLGSAGDPFYQTPVLLSLYGLSVYQQDEERNELSGALLRAYAISGVSTVLIKGIANRDRPSDRWTGGKFGFPSGHVSTSFAMSAVLDAKYGPQVGVPAYLVSGLIGWSRIDEQDHELSDVLFGAVLGYVIGKSVGDRQWGQSGHLTLHPFLHPTENVTGVLMEWRY